MDALTFRRMTSEDRRGVFGLLSGLLLDDPYARDSARAYRGAAFGREDAEAALGEALSLFIERPDYGFIWLALDATQAVGCTGVSYAISATAGALVAGLDYVVVAPGQRRRGIGRAMIESLAAHLRLIEIVRIEVDVHVDNAAGKAFYHSLGFDATHEERMTRVL